MKYLSFTGQIDLEWGMRAEMDNKTALTAAWRDHARAARFEGGRCSRCGTVQFPRTHLCVNPDCRAQDTQEPRESRRACRRACCRTPATTSPTRRTRRSSSGTSTSKAAVAC